MSVTWNAVGSDKSLKDITDIATGAAYPSPSGDYELKVQDDGNLVFYENGTASWFIGADHANVPIWRKKTVTGTTDSNGRLSLSINKANYTVVSANITSHNEYAAVPYSGGTNWNVYIGSTTNNMAKVASTSITVDVLYVDKV